MTTSVVEKDLTNISSEDYLNTNQDQMVENWGPQAVDKNSVNAVLKFMEQHPDWDFGMPGALVHFVEKMYGKGYEALLLDSIMRRPTPHTLWMLNRVINGEKNQERRKSFINAFLHTASDEKNDAIVIDRARHFLSLHTK